MQRNLRHNNWRTKCPCPCPYVHVHVYVTCMSLSLSMSTDMDKDMTWTWHIICICIYDFQHCYHSSLFTIQHYVLFGVYYFKPFWPFRHYLPFDVLSHSALVALSLLSFRHYLPSNILSFWPFFTIPRFFRRPFVPFDVLSVNIFYRRRFLLWHFVSESLFLISESCQSLEGIFVGLPLPSKPCDIFSEG
jgi:hypothetical protein